MHGTNGQKQKTALLPAPFLIATNGSGPLRLALAGATRSGAAGGDDPVTTLRRHRLESREAGELAIQGYISASPSQSH
jgi:hypothetical protein